MGKNFRKNRGEIAKVEKIFGKIFQKIVEIFQKIVENSEKIVEIFQKKFQKIVENLRKPLPPTYKPARNPKKFSSRIA